MPHSSHSLVITGTLLVVLALAGCAAVPSTTAPPAGSAAPTQSITTARSTQPATLAEPTTADADLAGYFEGFAGAFVMYDLQSDRYTRYNPERGAERFLPASTFKIMNAMIGLETGVIPDENYSLPWDGTRYDVASWNQNHTLKTAMQNSVVWYFQELARRVGRDKIQQHIDAAGYGNRDLSGALDSFWLDGGLRISADEQVRFLTRLYRNDLPFSARTMNVVKGILVLDSTPAYRLSGKTGAVTRVTPYQGWFVGYLESAGQVYVFATNIEGRGPEASGVKAQAITRNVLRGLGLEP